MSRRYTVAIDGPAGAGKSTVAREVAAALGYRYVDTGAMYRAVTLLALERNVDLNDGQALSELANNAKIDIIEGEGKYTVVLLNGADVTGLIREPRVTNNVSRVAGIPGVRKVLAGLQRSMAAEGGVVMEGRDIGTAVVPDADFKFYIVASAAERARRRAGDLKRMGFEADLEKLLKEIEARDYLDSSREVDPLKPAPDALVIDCTALTAEEVRDLIVMYVREKSEGRS